MSDRVVPTDLISHRGSMLLLDRIVACDTAQCHAEYTPLSDGWYADGEGNMPAWIGIELMAQTVAAQVGAEKRALGLAPKAGVLLGTRSYQAAIPSFRAAECLAIMARLLFRDDSGLAAYECEIRRTVAAQELLASATLKTFEPEDFSAFVKGSPA